MKINEVEALVGITKKNIRFYEEKGLLAPSRNSENGYRDYGQTEVDILRRIKLLRKLGVPIEEIRRMQEGCQTVGDGMRRHLVTLERERRNIDEAVRLCSLLREKEMPLNDLDAESVLAEMEHLEQSGTTFQNKQKQDVRIRYVAPVVIAGAMVVLLSALIGLMLWAFVTDRAAAPPLAVMVILTAVPGLVICGVLYALYQRIAEIGKGEIDDAKNTKKKIAPIVIAVLVVLYFGPIMAGMAALAGFFGANDAEGLVPFILLYALAGGAVIVGVLAAMAQRLREIDGGEEDEARKY